MIAFIVARRQPADTDAGQAVLADRAVTDRMSGGGRGAVVHDWVLMSMEDGLVVSVGCGVDDE